MPVSLKPLYTPERQHIALNPPPDPIIATCGTYIFQEGTQDKFKESLTRQTTVKYNLNVLKVSEKIHLF